MYNEIQINKEDAARCIRAALVAGAVLLIIFIAGCTTSHSTPQRGNDTLGILEEARANAKIPALAALTIRDGEVLNQYYLGKPDLDGNHITAQDTTFMCASISKPVTATAIMLLVQDGQIDLDNRADAYLPFPLSNPHFPGEAITVRMLLTHTSSLRDNWDVLDPLYTISDGGGDSLVGLEKLNREYFLPGGLWYGEKENFQRRKGPGEIHEYCNMNFALLGQMVEEVAGQTFPDFCREMIFEPLGMDNTTWMLADADITRLAVPYNVSRSGTEALPHYGYPSYPDGQLRTTVGDYGRFMTIFFPGGDLLSTSVREEFLRVQFPEVHMYQALAWNYDEFENGIIRRMIGIVPAHTGGDPGVATIAVMNPENRTAVVIFTNGFRTNNKGIIALYVKILSTLWREAAGEL